jgi:hypothetical protein
MRTLRHHLEQLPSWYPNLFLEPHLIAAVAVLSEYSESPARFSIRSENIPQLEEVGIEHALSLSWKRDTKRKSERLRATVQRKPLIEMAALAVALSVARNILDLQTLDITSYGDRADFRSLDRRCVLEISGTEVATEFGRRHRQKIAQAMANPFGWEAYVVVCLFSAEGHSIHLSRQASLE